jgi:hypothetical protein
MLRYMKDLFPVIWLSKIEIFTAGGSSSDIEILESKRTSRKHQTIVDG